MKTIKILIIVSILLIPAMGAKPKKPGMVGLRARVERLEMITSHQGKRIVLLNDEVEDLNNRIDDLEGLCLRCCRRF